MKVVRTLYFALTAFTIGFLPLIQLGCSNIPVPQDVNQDITYSIAGVSGIRATTTELLTAKQITSDEAQTVQNYANTARTGLDVAFKFMQQGLETKAKNSLDLAKSVLQSAKDFLGKYTNPSGGK